MRDCDDLGVICRSVAATAKGRRMMKAMDGEVGAEGGRGMVVGDGDEVAWRTWVPKWN